MNFRRLFKNRGLGVNLLASFCFILLAVYGWGLTWSELGRFVLVFALLLSGLIVAAAICGWLLRKLMSFFESPSSLVDDTDSVVNQANTKQESDKPQ